MTRTAMIEQGTDELRDAELRVVDAVGSLIEFWGFKRPMGRLWTLAFLSPEPLSQADFAERLSMSTGAVSMALTELLRWGVLRRTWRPGERRDFYEPETNVWKMVSRVFRERELVMIRDTAETFASAEATIRQAARGLRGEQAKRLRFIVARVGQLKALARFGETMLGALLSGGRVNPRPLENLDELDPDDE